MRWLICVFVLMLLVACGGPDPIHDGRVTAISHVPGSDGIFGSADDFRLTVKDSTGHQRRPYVSAEQWKDCHIGDLVSVTESGSLIGECHK